MSQVDVDSGIENMEVDENDRREKRSLTDKVSLAYVGTRVQEWCRAVACSEFSYLHIFSHPSSVNCEQVLEREKTIKSANIKASFLFISNWVTHNIWKLWRKCFCYISYNEMTCSCPAPFLICSKPAEIVLQTLLKIVAANLYSI